MANIITDGELEDWASATDLTSWTEGADGDSTVNRESTNVHGGTYSCRFDIDASNSAVQINQNLTLTPGAKYGLSMWHYWSVAGKNGLVQVTDVGENIFLKPDGTWNSGTDYVFTLNNTSWSEDSVNFNAHASYANYNIMILRNNCPSSSLYFDDILLEINELSVEDISDSLSLGESSVLIGGTDVASTSDSASLAETILSQIEFNPVKVIADHSTPPSEFWGTW